MIVVNKYNKGPINKFKFGGFSDWANIAQGVGGAASGLISDGLQSKAGAITSGLSSVASAIPGPWGKIASAGLNLVGGAVNRLWGSNINEQAVASFNAENAAQANRVFGGSTNEELMGQSNFSLLGNIEKSQVGRDGVFSKKAANKTRELNHARQLANSQAINNFGAAVDNLDRMKDREVLRNITAFGGKLGTHGALWDTGLTEINEGGSHESNPNEGIQVGVDPEGVPNLVEEGEVIHNNYVFSKRLKADGGLLDMVNLPSKYNNKPYADVAKKLAEESKERPNDPISKRSFEDAITKLQMAQEYTRQMQQMQEANKFACGGKKNKFSGTEESSTIEPLNLKGVYRGHSIGFPQMALGVPVPPSTSPYLNITEKDFMPYESTVKETDPVLGDPIAYNTSLRYAPLAANAAAFMQNVLSKPDYSGADSIERAALAATNYPVANTGFNAQYMKFNPFDTNYYATKLSNQASANRQAIINNNNGNVGAMTTNMLAQNYNDQTQLGDLYRKGAESDYEQLSKVLAFNNSINQSKAEMAAKNTAANQDAFFKSRSALMDAVMQGAKIRNDVDNARAAAMNASLTNFVESLSKIGKENMAFNMVNSNKGQYYSIGKDGVVKYKQDFYGLDDDTRWRVKRQAGKEAKAKANNQKKGVTNG